MKNYRILKSRPAGFFYDFVQRPPQSRKTTHYCPGCGHGILHKIIAEAISEFEIKDRTTFISPVGCAVFAYHYMDCFGISTPHGRAPAVATGLSRAHPESVVISYQGDGDLAAIGFNEFFHSLNRAENICFVFVNNSVYGMTGGQMAPTTLVGQKTSTTPRGRSLCENGAPFGVTEIVAAHENAVFAERVALTNPREIMKARSAIRKAIKNTIARKGVSFVEVLAPCPSGMKKDCSGANNFIQDEMTKIFPLGKFKDISENAESSTLPTLVLEPARVKKILLGAGEKFASAETLEEKRPRARSKIFAKERRIKISGAGGQGVLSLAFIIAHMARLRKFNVTYLPTYGPEMRGGTADCSIVASRAEIASPVVDKDANMLVALNRPSLEKYLPQLKATGILIYDSSIISEIPKIGKTQIAFGVPATTLATEIFGSPRFGNALILGAFSKMMEECFLLPEDVEDFRHAAEEAVRECFSEKPELIEPNLRGFALGRERAQRI